MATDLGSTCSCGERHGELPLSFHAEAPAYWTPELDGRPGCELTSDQCVINGQHFFVRGLIEIPVLDTGEVFSWGVWVSLSEATFLHASTRWYEDGRENDEAYFGWLSTELSCYPATTLNLKTNLHTRPIGLRGFVELEPTDHPLAVEQRDGITTARVQQIAEQLLHSDAN